MMTKNIIATEKAPAAIGPYAQANEAGGFVYVSGQLPLDPATGKMPEGIEAQTEQALINVRNIIEAAGGTMDDVVKTTCFLKDMDEFGKMNEVYGRAFTEGKYPARAAVEVSALPKPEALVEIEAVAYIK